MMKASGLSAVLSRSAVPVLPGVEELLEAGNVSGGTSRNMEALGDAVSFEDGVSELDFVLMADAQTSGVMLISVPEDCAGALVKSLIANETLCSEVIGEVVTGDAGTVVVRK
jgi:selenide,water dikinase